MSFNGFCKRTAFWTNDLIHGRKVRKHFDEIKHVMKNPAAGKVIQQKKLEQLLTYATKYSSFYQTYVGKPLHAFPVVNKTILTENYDQIVVPVQYIPEQETETVHIQKTSGSTGTPFAIHQDSRKRHRRVAELKYFGETVGFKSHEKMAQCRIWTNWHSKTKLQVFKENIYPINVSKIDDATLKELCDTVKQHKIIAIRAYASWYDNLLDYFTSGKGDIAALKTIKVMFSTSEALNIATKEKFLEKYGIPIVECYANEEAGTMAHQQLGNSNFYLNHASYIFENLKLDSDEPAEYGELARIVITDLTNYAFPLIRYDTGDTAVFEVENKFDNSQSGGVVYISKLYGRRMDIIYDVYDQPIHPMSFGRTLKNFSTIRQWQFVQRGHGKYTVRLQATKKDEFEAILKELKKVVGETAEIAIEEVSEIPVLASGKKKPVVNEWKQ